MNLRRRNLYLGLLFMALLMTIFIGVYYLLYSDYKRQFPVLVYSCDIAQLSHPNDFEVSDKSPIIVLLRGNNAEKLLLANGITIETDQNYFALRGKKVIRLKPIAFRSSKVFLQTTEDDINSINFYKTNPKNVFIP